MGVENIVATNPAVGSNASIDQTTDAGMITGPSSMGLVESLLYTNPEYDKYRKKWRKYLDLYESDNVYQYLHRHPREGQDKYDARVKRGYFYNYVAGIVDLYVAYLFHSPVTRNAGNVDSEVLTDVLRDADRRGTPYEKFLQKVGTFSQLLGHHGILVDATELPGEMISERDRKDYNVRPFLRSIRATDILDWELDERGRFRWAKIEVYPPQDRDFQVSVDQVTRYFQIWDQDTWTTYKVKDDTATIYKSGTHRLGEVPLVICRSTDSLCHDWMGVSAVRDIADINIAVMNWSSFGDEEIAERCLNILAMERGDAESTINFSHANVLEFDRCDNPPYYLTPGQTPLELIGQWIDRGKDEIFRLAKMGGTVGNRKSREATSGIAYAFEFNETNQSLAQKAEALEGAELQVYTLLAKWGGKDSWDGSIIYPKEFGVDDFLTDLRILMDARSQFTSQTAIRETEKKVARKMFAKDPEKILDKILKEIEEAPEIDTFAPKPLSPGHGPVAAREPVREAKEKKEASEPEDDSAEDDEE